MNINNIKWQDAWVMQAIYHSKDHSLFDIISTADYLNHAIFRYDEFNQAIKKLISMNYVEIKADKIKVSSKFIQDFEDYKKSKKWGINKERDKIKQLLIIKSKNLLLDRSPDYPKDEFNEALENYSNKK